MIDKLIDPVSKIVNKFVKDKDLQAKLDHELNTLFHEANLAQVKVNLKEAEHKSIFVSGWRPFLGWGLSFAMIWHFVFVPMITFGFAYAGVEPPELPAFDMDSLMTVLLGMLGLGGLRTFEKAKGLTK